jgi:hypothetical protein
MSYCWKVINFYRAECTREQQWNRRCLKRIFLAFF